MEKIISVVKIELQGFAAAFVGSLLYKYYLAEPQKSKSEVVANPLNL